jgi:acyl-CoA synthetase (AMP-forming)/AMP-acid ligase II
VAVVVAKLHESPGASVLQAFCRERLAGFKTPKRVIFQSDPLPRTATGKVQKYLLVERYRQVRAE